ncbi:MAG: hypothetical protein GF334_05825 [Candidatus Altiarchaeales archaeon]|nr:hypothetical protein [Candidatus Altiarchaeales archaeon]
MDVSKVFCVVLLLLTSLSGYSWASLRLYVGNDATYEFSEPDGDFTSVTSDNLAYEFNKYAHREWQCTCDGCVEQGDLCLVPVRVESPYSGTLTVEDAEVSYFGREAVANVSYGDTFAKSEGGCWRIQAQGGAPHVVSNPAGLDCSAGEDFEYTASTHDYPQTNDAAVDSMYRLLNESLDTNPRNGLIGPPGEIDYTGDGFYFDSTDLIRGQGLWGPVELRLVLWI